MPHFCRLKGSNPIESIYITWLIGELLFEIATFHAENQKCSNAFTLYAIVFLSLLQILLLIGVLMYLLGKIYSLIHLPFA